MAIIVKNRRGGPARTITPCEFGCGAMLSAREKLLHSCPEREAEMDRRWEEGWRRGVLNRTGKPAKEKVA